MIVRIPQNLPETPAWAETFGVDAHGIFAGIGVGQASLMLRWIEPGTFTMGSPEDELGRYGDEGPQHEVTISRGFWLGRTPVTQAFYEAVVGSNPSEFEGDLQRPVEKVSWDDAVAFCDRLNGLLPADGETHARLPTEAEWEYACRAGPRGTGALYSGKPLTSEEGTCPNLAELAWYDENSEGKTHPVGEKEPNDWGLHDMQGNVREWCQDEWHSSHEGAPDDGSAWCDEASEGGYRVYRGGCWANLARYCRCASRYYWQPDSRDSYVGFRLVLATPG
jgi:formylglycine-generating enzyme required for sulfatase activity